MPKTISKPANKPTRKPTCYVVRCIRIDGDAGVSGEHYELRQHIDEPGEQVDNYEHGKQLALARKLAPVYMCEPTVKTIDGTWLKTLAYSVEVN